MPNTTCSLSSQALSNGEGLLVAVVDVEQGYANIVGSVPVAGGGNVQEAADSLQRLLPSGLFVVGSYTTAGQPSWLPQHNTSSSLPTVCATNISAAEGPTWTVNGQQQKDGLPAAASAAATDSPLDIAAGFVPVRAHLDVELHVTFTASSTGAAVANGTAAANGKSDSSSAAKQQPSPPAAAIQAAMQQLSAQLLSQPQQLVFVTEQQPSASQSGSQQKASAVTIITANGSSSSSVEQALGTGDTPCISILPLQHTSSSSSKALPPAPMFEYHPSANSGSSSQQQQLLTVALSLDVLCYAPSSSSLPHLHSSLLVPALQQQLQAMEQLLVQQAAAGQPLSPIKALHFRPPVLPFPVTVCYPLAPGSPEAAESVLLGRRRELHQLLGLPENIPMLRFANALTWGPEGSGGADSSSSSSSRSVRLRSVHETLTPPGFGGQVYLVDGAYEYFHYMQDKFNDNGWGCAYRSLQTIISWFRLQHYTSKPVPGHRQIQEILVSLGDKEPSFIGSNQWIGAIELSYILDTYLDITCKILAINQGADIPSHARALAQHFATQGTPVMIGGGVLAYTLLGVAFNEDTGEAAFLILDPHYTGGEDLKKIVQGTWVAWKQLGDTAAAGGPLFVKDAFYNFLCPQRPRTV